MANFIQRFPLSRFDELVPLLLRCFPAFWEVRLARGMRSFPYDLRLFCAVLDGRRIGTVGIHEYRFLLDGNVTACGGLCDVGVDPAFRGRGYAGKLQEFALADCREHYPSCPMMPLYTDKPGVYLSRAWRPCEPDRTREIRTEDFPKRNAFRPDTGESALDVLRGKRPARNDMEKTLRRIQKIYSRGVSFNDRLLEAYSADPAHPVNAFLPVQGGHDANKIMVNLQAGGTEVMKRIGELLERRQLCFPIADTF